MMQQQAFPLATGEQTLLEQQQRTIMTQQQAILQQQPVPRQQQQLQELVHALQDQHRLQLLQHQLLLSERVSTLRETSVTLSAMIQGHQRDLDAVTATLAGYADPGASKGANAKQQQQQQQPAALNKDDILDAIFESVGSGEYYYIAAVCRRWRGRYLQLGSTDSNAAAQRAHKKLRLVTDRQAAIASLPRLRLAFANSATVQQLQQPYTVRGRTAFFARDMHPQRA
jgi:hypothetical protein